MNTVLNIPNCDVTMMARVVEPDKGDLSMAEWACASQAMARIAEFVRQRAGGVCEYCRVPDGLIPARHQLDHIIATKHRGSDDASNRALACFPCNHNKGPCIAGVDPATGKIVRLFHPRRHKWSAHFQWTVLFSWAERRLGGRPLKFWKSTCHAVSEFASR